MENKNEMIYFFSGASNQEQKLKYNCDQLFSAYHERKLLKKIIKKRNEDPNLTFRVMLDSGAFSHYMNSKKKGHILTDAEYTEYTDDYIKFLNDEVGEDLFCFVGVDRVPDPTNVDPTFADKTWENYLYMYERLKPEIRDKLIPVFHYGEDFKHLKRFLEYTHEDGSHLDYIGLAISLEGTTKVRISWAQECERIIAESSDPDVKTHAFGVGVKSVLEHIHPTSTDATSWVKRSCYGMISINDKTIYISDIQKANLKKGAHYTERGKAYQDEVEKLIQERGFTIDELEKDPYKRAEFNIIDTQMWMKELNQKNNQTKHQKKALW